MQRRIGLRSSTPKLVRKQRRGARSRFSLEHIAIQPKGAQRPIYARLARWTSCGGSDVLRVWGPDGVGKERCEADIIDSLKCVPPVCYLVSYTKLGDVMLEVESKNSPS
jgi:hypothetical protein